jgi:hypothetical protein
MARETGSRADIDPSTWVAYRPEHMAYAVSLHDRHALVIVTVADPRGDGRPRRMLAGLRIAVGRTDLVGLPPLDVSLKVARAVVEALSAQVPTVDRRRRPEPPGGLQGRPVIMRGQEQLPFD